MSKRGGRNGMVLEKKGGREAVTFAYSQVRRGGVWGGGGGGVKKRGRGGGGGRGRVRGGGG